jgi:alkanesulfonate monooxygenase SsuD/methylene tetrahydromethanopterin reductase-like flavin-dependent oxidoreductase (luciferase family)
MMPLHPAHRDAAVTLDEDREAIILADKLGFYDAFVGEHLTEKSENITRARSSSRRARPTCRTRTRRSSPRMPRCSTTSPRDASSSA